MKLLPGVFAAQLGGFDCSQLPSVPESVIVAQPPRQPGSEEPVRGLHTGQSPQGGQRGQAALPSARGETQTILPEGTAAHLRGVPDLQSTQGP